MGWDYIYKRLINTIIIYEESDWHDGQYWKKPEAWQRKDSIVAKFDVLPIIKRLKYWNL